MLAALCEEKEIDWSRVSGNRAAPASPLHSLSRS
jgi:hypothetical protein